MVQQRQKDKILLTCSVMEFKNCRHTVEWLNEGREEMFSDVEKPEQPCSATVTFPASVRNWKLKSEILKCKITNIDTNEVQLFAFRIQSSGGRTDKDSAAKTTTATQPPTTTSTRKSTTTKSITKTIQSTTAESNKWTSMAINPSTNVNNSSKSPGWFWLFVIRPVGLAAMMITVLLIIRWMKTKGNKTKEEESETDPEDDLTPKRPKGPRKKSESLTLTNSTVNTSSAPTDPNSLYCNLSH
ncbi:uncharacterized protein FYW61_020423 [Anableps anableps]